METAFQRALNRYIRTGQATPKELSRVVGVTASHIRAVARGDRHLPHPKVETLSSWLVDERGLTEHIDGMLGMSGATHFHPGEVDNDDCIRDEIYEARSLAGEADAALKSGDRPEAARLMRQAIEESKAALADIETPSSDR